MKNTYADSRIINNNTNNSSIDGISHSGTESGRFVFVFSLSLVFTHCNISFWFEREDDENETDATNETTKA